MAKKKKKAKKGKKSAAAAKPPTKSQIYNGIADATGLKRKEVVGVFDALSVQVKKSLRKHGQFTVPGLCKMKVKRVPAKKARKGINPFTGEEMMFKAKPASKKVRCLPIKAVKDMV